jgi:hypothetical protein
MNSILRRTLATSAAAIVGAAIFGGTAFAHAASAATHDATATATTPPPWEPDPNTVGALLFFNSAGKQITSGSTNASPIAAYVEGTTTIRAGDKLATLYGYLPVKGLATGEFDGEALGESTTYPNTKAPKPINGLKVPVETGNSGDETIAQLAEDFPNKGGAGYAGMYQLRLRTSGPGEAPTITYDSADIHISGNTWTVSYSKTPTVTTLTSSPKTSAYHGVTVTLTASISPSDVAGNVEFKDGSAALKTVAVKNGKAIFATETLPDGVQKLSASFAPTNTTSYVSSTSAVHDLTVEAHPTVTTLKASATSIKSGQTLKLTATETPAAAGSITFYSGTAKLATVKVSKGAATYSTSKLSVGSHVLKAVFAATVPADYAGSTSKVVKVTVKS